MPNETRETTIDQISTFTKNTLTSIKEAKYSYVTITFIIIFFILFSLLSWLYTKLSISEKSCKNLEVLYKDPNPYKSVGIIGGDGKVKNNIKNKFSLDFQKSKTELKNNAVPRNFHIKTAYNCCCIDGYKNNFVDLCALRECIKLGARCLDFEIYSVDNNPVIASSTANNNNIKETYNVVLLKDALQTIKDMAFDELHTNSYNDPLYLHFRIMSENLPIYDKIGELIKTILFENKENNILQYQMNISNKNYSGDVFLEEPLEKFANKIIIMCNSKNKKLIQNNKLADVTNLLSDGNHMELIRFETLDAIGNRGNSLLSNSAKNKFIMVLPNINNKLENFDFTKALESGCQFIGMKFQNYDINLQGYFEHFRNAGGYSFIEKMNNTLPINDDKESTIAVTQNIGELPTL